MFKYLYKHLHTVLCKYLFLILLAMFLRVELFSYLINFYTFKNYKLIYKVATSFNTSTCNSCKIVCTLSFNISFYLFDHSYTSELVFVALICILLITNIFGNIFHSIVFLLKCLFISSTPLNLSYLVLL